MVPRFLPFASLVFLFLVSVGFGLDTDFGLFSFFSTFLGEDFLVCSEPVNLFLGAEDDFAGGCFEEAGGAIFFVATGFAGGLLAVSFLSVGVCAKFSFFAVSAGLLLDSIFFVGCKAGTGGSVLSITFPFAVEVPLGLSPAGFMVGCFGLGSVFGSTFGFVLYVTPRSLRTLCTGPLLG